MRRAVALLVLPLAIAALVAWDAPGHRTVTEVALDLLPDGMPSWLRDPHVRAQVEFQSNEPDHYRGVKNAVLAHENNPDHYMDVELLDKHHLSLRTLPPLRYEFVAQLVRTATPEPAPEPGTDGSKPPRRGVDRRALTDDLGFVPYAIAEHYAKLVSSFSTLRILEQLDQPARADELAAAKANVVHEMGQLSHFVGDAAQPLHTTIHHHGWVGANPDGFTTDRNFHARIDGEVVALHRLDAPAIAAAKVARKEIAPDKVWEETIGLLERSFAAVRPLYLAEKDGTLDQEPGRLLIRERMADAAAVLAGLYAAAWKESEPTEQGVRDFVRYDRLEGAARPSAGPGS